MAGAVTIAGGLLETGRVKGILECQLSGESVGSTHGPSLPKNKIIT